jgi:hypothetical protein
VLFLKGAFFSEDNGKSWRPCNYEIYYFTAFDKHMKGWYLKRQLPKEFMDATFKQEPKGKIMSILASIRKAVSKAKN